MQGALFLPNRRRHEWCGVYKKIALLRSNEKIPEHRYYIHIIVVEKLRKRSRLILRMSGVYLPQQPSQPPCLGTTRTKQQQSAPSSSSPFFSLQFLVGRVCHPDALSGTCGGMSFAKKLLFGVSRLWWVGVCLRECADHRLVCMCAHTFVVIKICLRGKEKKKRGKRKWLKKKKKLYNMIRRGGCKPGEELVVC